MLTPLLATILVQLTVAMLLNTPPALKIAVKSLPFVVESPVLAPPQAISPVWSL